MALSLQEAGSRLQERHGSHLLAKGQKLPFLPPSENEIGVITVRCEQSCQISEVYLCGEQQPRVTETVTEIGVREGQITVFAGEEVHNLTPGQWIEIPRKVPFHCQGEGFAQVINTPPPTEKTFRFIEH